MMERCLDKLVATIGDPNIGLPEPLFLLVSRLTPLINVDLLIKNDSGNTLLTWRDDQFHGPGWHVPGGIIRFKETAQARIHKVAMNEFGGTVIAEDRALAINELIAPRRNVRGHFISMLYRCRLTSQLDATRQAFSDHSLQAGQWRWHAKSPANLIEQHECYRSFIDSART